MAGLLRTATGVLGVASVTLVYTRLLGVTNSTTVALTFLLVVLFVAATSRFWIAAITSIAALFCLNFFFIPPVGTLTVADPENWVALAAFFAVSLVGSNLSSAMRQREQQALERVQLVEERKQAELARQRDALTSALLASIGHDLRTPLTALRVAATNLQFEELTPADRTEQTEVVLAEVERLTRRFENILDMARIDAHAVAAERRWVHPSEIYDAACDQVSHALTRHRIDASIMDSHVVLLDPRLTAVALARVLENAARYAPEDTVIAVALRLRTEGLTITVADRGPGIAAGDLPRVFDRGYRGELKGARVSGTGMGLAIARGLLMAQDGQIEAENRHDGGTTFTITIPAEQRLLTTMQAAAS